MIKVIFFGTPDYVSPIIQALRKNFKLVGTVRSTNELDEEYLKKLQPDLFVVAAFGKIIPQNILNIPKYGALNIHPSLLPKFRGASPIQAAILAGETETGITIIKMDAEMDHGPIVYQETSVISDQATLATLSDRLFKKAAQVLPEVIDKFIKRKITPRGQDEAIATYCNLIKKEGGYFDISNPPDPKTLDRMIRAYDPWPTAWTKWQGKIVKFLPGGLVQMEGKNPTLLKNFLNGHPKFPINALQESLYG